MMNKLYALVTRHCNLSCPYCIIRNSKEEYNRDLFMQKLKEFDGRIILFGGEPTLYRDRLKDVYYSDPDITKKITSITTNLMIMDTEILDILKSIENVASSWSPSRFTDDEYKIWLKNVDTINGEVGISILSTMTDELLLLTPKELMKIMSEWNTNTIKNINFEYYVGDETSPEYFERCDEWLCSVYKEWDSPIIMVNSHIVRNSNYCYNCDNTYSLYPDGIIKSGCPHRVNPVVPEECYTCERSDICRPCRLQRFCSYPKRFAALVNNERS